MCFVNVGLGLGQVPSGSKAQRKPTTFPLEPEANSKEIQRRKELSEWPGGSTSRSSTGRTRTNLQLSSNKSYY